MGRLRIIAGRLKGRRLDVPSVPGLRPTGERIREALFGILGSSLAGARVLDAYCGTGALGLEALSRGASAVVFIEVDAVAVRALTRVLERLGIAGECTVLRGPVAATLASGRVPGRFDLILADPPYEADEARGFLARAGERLASGGRIVLERDARSGVEEAGGLVCYRSAVYGRARLDFYRWPGAGGGGPVFPAG